MPYDKALVINDTHFQWQNDGAIEIALKVGQKVNPHVIFLNGDIIDCAEISKFDKNLDHSDRNDLGSELESVRVFLKSLRKRFPKSRIVYIFGNHEYRWNVFIAKRAPELHGLLGMTLQDQLELHQNKIECIYSGNKESSYLWGKLLIGHFDAVNSYSGVTAKNLLDRKGISLIQAHTHRGGSSFKRLWDRDIVAYENFCLCDRSPAYVDRPNWQLGFSVIYKDKDHDHFSVEQHPIVETASGELKASYNGTCISN